MITAQVVQVAGRPAGVTALTVTIPDGRIGTVTGETAQGETWSVATLTGTGEPIVFADPAGPLGESATYRLTYGATVETAGPVVRQSPGGCVITSLDGTRGTVCTWLGDDPQDPEPQITEIVVRGAAAPIHNISPAMLGSGGLTVHTESRAASAALVALLGGSVWLLHDAAGCQITDCDIPPARLVVLTQDSHRRVLANGAAWREHALAYRYTTPPVGYRAPVVTYAETSAVGRTYGQWTATGRSYVDRSAGVGVVS